MTARTLGPPVENGKLAGAEDRRIRAGRQSPAGAPKASVLLLHGCAEHLGGDEQLVVTITARLDARTRRGMGDSAGDEGER